MVFRILAGTVVLPLLLCVRVEFSGAGEPGLCDAVLRLRREGIRAKSRGDVRRMETAGFNLVLPWGGQLLEGAGKSQPADSDILLTPEDFSEEAIRELRQWAADAHRHNQLLMPMIYVAGESSIRFLTGLDGDLRQYVRTGNGAKRLWPRHNLRRIVDWNGHRARWAPCPLDRRYWSGFIQPQLEQVARTLNETGACGGAALELETYCFFSIYPGVSSQKAAYCFCDECFGGFLREQQTPGQNGLPEPGRRFDWLTQRGLLPDYEQSLETRLADRIREMIGRVRRIRSDFLFGFYPYAPSWYCDGLIRGASTDRLPCLLFPSAEYDGGYTTEPISTFFGDVSTSDALRHLQHHRLSILYAGGLWTRAMGSAPAVATAMDRLLREADGYWVYDRPTNELWEMAGRMNAWSSEHGSADGQPLVSHDARDVIRVDLLPDAAVQTKAEPGWRSTADGLTAGYIGEGTAVCLWGNVDGRTPQPSVRFTGRGQLPAQDGTVCHDDGASLRFEPAAASDGPVSPYVDIQVPAEAAAAGQKYELCWHMRCRASEPVRVWVGQADQQQYPGVLYYHNFMLSPKTDWVRRRIEVRLRKAPPLMLRFWVPPTDGTVWVDDVILRPVHEKQLSVPLTCPPGADGWGTVHWKLAPPDARCEAAVVDPDSGEVLMTRLNSGDSLAALEAVTNSRQVTLQLQVTPGPDAPVTFTQLSVRFPRDSSQ